MTFPAIVVFEGKHKISYRGAADMGHRNLAIIESADTPGYREALDDCNWSFACVGTFFMEVGHGRETRNK